MNTPIEWAAAQSLPSLNTHEPMRAERTPKDHGEEGQRGHEDARRERHRRLETALLPLELFRGDDTHHKASSEWEANALDEDHERGPGLGEGLQGPQ